MSISTMAGLSGSDRSCGTMASSTKSVSEQSSLPSAAGTKGIVIFFDTLSAREVRDSVLAAVNGIFFSVGISARSSCEFEFQRDHFDEETL